MPGEEATVLDQLKPEDGTTERRLAEVSLDADSVILVGERAAGLSGDVQCMSCDSPSAPAPGWPGCRAGPGIAGRLKLAACRTCFPAADRWQTPLPASTPRRRGESSPCRPWKAATRIEILIAAADGELEALVVAGVDPNDFVDPQAALEGLEAVGFMVSLETRASLVTERADVVFPVSLMQERAGTFVNWEGRRRPFDIVLERPNDMSDLRVLAALADGLGG